MDLFLVAHDILGYTSKSKWVVTKEAGGQEVYKPIAYDWHSIEKLKSVFPKHDLKELKYAIDLLFENKHADKLSADDWLHIRVACLETGEQAYDTKFYINLRDQTRAKSSATWRKNKWLLLAALAFLLSSIIAPLTVEWLKKCLWQETNQSDTTTSTKTDTTLKR